MKNQYEIDYQQGYDNANDEWLDRIDKIKAEIRANSIYVMPQYGRTIREADVLQILDKYKADKGQE